MAKIALIDDSSATLDMLSSILKGAGHSVQTLSSGVGAESVLAADAPNLVLLDVDPVGLVRGRELPGAEDLEDLVGIREVGLGLLDGPPGRHGGAAYRRSSV